MQRKIIKPLPFLMLILAIVFCNSAIAFRNTARLNYAQLQPSTTADLFVVALVRNDEKLLRAIVIPEQSEEVSQWLLSRSPFYCPFGLDNYRGWTRDLRRLKSVRFTSQNVYLFEHPDRLFPGKSSDASFTSQNFQLDEQNPDDSATVGFDAFYQCIKTSSSRGLNFEVEDIVIERKGNKWYVRSWKFTCESKAPYGCR